MRGWYSGKYAGDLYDVAHSWSAVFPDIFPTPQDAGQYIRENLKPDLHGEFYTGELLNSYIDNYLTNKVSINTKGRKIVKPSYSGSKGEACRWSVQERGYYSAGFQILYLSSFTASVWIALYMCKSNDFEAGKLAVANIEPRLVSAVKNKLMRQLDSDGIGRLDYGVYQSDGLFLGSDIRKWAEDVFPALTLGDFYDEEIYVLVQELHGERGKIYNYCRLNGLLEGVLPSPKQEVSSNMRRERSGAAKDFVQLGIEAYRKCYGAEPEKLSQLLNFAKTKQDAVKGCTIVDEGKGNDRRIYFWS